VGRRSIDGILQYHLVLAVDAAARPGRICSDRGHDGVGFYHL